MDRLDTTHAANVGSAKEKQHGYFNRLASIFTAQFDSVMLLLQVML
ncbi:MAG: hypothetical protein Q8Q54_00070 [Methylococcales bacterium]|nr:hypothetical protein [Methylococcales bacterium]MDP3837299.1 hypothetical protein [Methylococcales bacterium]